MKFLFDFSTVYNHNLKSRISNSPFHKELWENTVTDVIQEQLSQRKAPENFLLKIRWLTQGHDAYRNPDCFRAVWSLPDLQFRFNDLSESMFTDIAANYHDEEFIIVKVNLADLRVRVYSVDTE